MDSESINTALDYNSISNFTTRSDCKGLAIITGSSSGMGRAFALRAASYGMTVIGMDLKIDLSLEQECIANGASNCSTYKCDVSSYENVSSIAKTVLAKYDTLPISLICANAGYGGPQLLSGTPKAIQKQIDVLTNGIIWTVKAFQEKFLKQPEPCAIVGTSSLAGLFPAGGSYGVGKHGAVATMESFYSEIKAMNLKHTISCHVLCPGIVATGITSSNLTELRGAQLSIEEAKKQLKRMVGKELMKTAFGLAFRIVLEEHGMKSEYAADTIFDAIEKGTFYLLMDHPDARYSTNASTSVGLRHRRLEIGAPPPT